MSFHPPEWIEQVPSTNSLLLERIASRRGALPGRWWPPTTRPGVAGAGSAPGSPARGATSPAPWCSKPRRTGERQLGIAVHGRRPGRGRLPGGARPDSADQVAQRRHRGSSQDRRDPARAGAGEAGSPGLVVLGIGLNLGMTRAEAEAIDQPATSVLVETGSAPSPREVLPRPAAAADAVAGGLDGGGLRRPARAAGRRAAPASGSGSPWSTTISGLSGVLAGFGDGGAAVSEGGRRRARGLGGEPVARSGLRRGQDTPKAPRVVLALPA